jgi:hypothetical protein
VALPNQSPLVKVLVGALEVGVTAIVLYLAGQGIPLLQTHHKEMMVVGLRRPDRMAVVEGAALAALALLLAEEIKAALAAQAPIIQSLDRR